MKLNCYLGYIFALSKIALVPNVNTNIPYIEKVHGRNSTSLKSSLTHWFLESVLYKTDSLASNFPTKGLRSKRRSSSCIFSGNCTPINPKFERAFNSSWHLKTLPILHIWQMIYWAIYTFIFLYRECQVKHWSKHKVSCNLMAEKR